MSRDELIRRAMLHATPRVARSGMAVGGKPGESAMAQAEANRNFSAGANRTGPASDNGFRSSPIGGGNAGANRLGSGSQISNTLSRTERTNILDNPAGAAARLGPNAAMAMRDAGVSPDTAIRGAMSLNRSGAPSMTRSLSPVNTGPQVDPSAEILNYNQSVRAPDMVSMTEATRTPNPLLDPNRFKFDNYGMMSGMQPDVLSRMVTMQDIYGRPVQVTSGYRSPTKNASVGGVEQSQHLTGNAVDLIGALRNPLDTAALINAGKQAGFTGFGAYNTPGKVHMDIGPARYWGPDTTKASVGTLDPAIQNALRSQAAAKAIANSSAAAPAPAQTATYTGPLPRPRPVPSIGQIKSADYQKIANAISGYNPTQTNQLAFGSAYSTSTPTAVGQKIAELKAMAANPNLTTAQKKQLQDEMIALREIGGIAVSPGTSMAPVPPNFVVDPKTGVISKSPGYNVVAGPMDIEGPMIGPIDDFQNISFAMPRDVPLVERGIAPNPNYGQMPAATAAVAQGPQNITNLGYQNDDFRGVLAKATPASTGVAPTQTAYGMDDFRAPPSSQQVAATAYGMDDFRAPPSAQQVAATPSVSNTVSDQVAVTPTTDMPSTMNYVPMVPRTPIPPPPDANIFQLVANAMLPENLFPNALYTQPTPPGQYLVQSPDNMGPLSGYMMEPFRIDRGIGVAKNPITGIEDPNANVITTASGRQMAFNPFSGRYEYVSKFRGSLDERPGGDNREQNREYTQGRQNRKLLSLGYTQAEIDAMSPEKIKEVLKNGIRKAASGGRIGYKKGGKSSTPVVDSYYGPAQLPDLPAFNSYGSPPTYSFPTPSPMISGFVGALPQPSSMPAMLPPVNTMAQPRPQYSQQSQYFNPFENLFGYNQSLLNMGQTMNSGGSVNTTNNSISNAMRLARR